MSKHKFERNPYKIERGEFRLTEFADKVVDGKKVIIYIVTAVCSCGNVAIFATMESDAPMFAVRAVALHKMSEDNVTQDESGILRCTDCNGSDIVSQAYKAIYGEDED